jgi:hypothetical protein
LSLVEVLPAEPEGIEHWTEREISARVDAQPDGQEWLALYRARPDPPGWKVYAAHRRRDVGPLLSLDMVRDGLRAFEELVELKNREIPDMESMVARLGITHYDLDQVIRRRDTLLVWIGLLETILAEAERGNKALTSEGAYA